VVRFNVADQKTQRGRNMKRHKSALLFRALDGYEWAGERSRSPGPCPRFTTSNTPDHGLRVQRVVIGEWVGTKHFEPRGYTNIPDQCHSEQHLVWLFIALNEATADRPARKANSKQKAGGLNCLNYVMTQSDNGRRHRAARVKLTIRKRVDAAPVHGMVIRFTRNSQLPVSSKEHDQ
jgi:hypothetical protein